MPYTLDFDSRLPLYLETKDESLVRKAWRSHSLAGSISSEGSASPAAGSDDPRVDEPVMRWHTAGHAQNKQTTAVAGVRVHEGCETSSKQEREVWEVAPRCAG